MKIDLNDPNLTAYALGELPAKEQAMMEKLVSQSPEAQGFVARTQELARRLDHEFRLELEDSEKEPLSILPVPYGRIFWSDARQFSIGLAALLVVSAVIAVVFLLRNHPNDVASNAAERRTAPQRPTPVEAEEAVTAEVVDDDRPAAAPSRAGASAATALAAGEQVFVVAAETPLSTFPLDVDTTAYSKVCQFIKSGVVPPREAVQIEGLINHFSYDYPQPAADQPFSINVEVASCPWQPGHRLLRIGLKAAPRATGKGEQSKGSYLPSDVQVEFNPAQVGSYRLIGYDQPASPMGEHNNEKTSAAEMGTGQAITAFYEFIPAPHGHGSAPESATLHGAVARRASALDLAVVRIQHKQSDSSATQTTERSITDTATEFGQASPDFRFAAAVAEFGMILRNSAYKGDGSMRSVLQWAEEAKGNDESGDRTAFIDCAREAQSLPL